MCISLNAIQNGTPANENIHILHSRIFLRISKFSEKNSNNRYKNTLKKIRIIETIENFLKKVKLSKNSTITKFSTKNLGC